MTQAQFPCCNCGATLQFTPGTSALNCDYCAVENPIAQSEDDIDETDFHAVLSQLAEQTPSEQTTTITCQSCKAEFTLDANIHADACPFCTSDVVAEPDQHQQLKPKALLPFDLSEKQARERFAQWLQSLWFAPDKVKQYANVDNSFSGIYVPYWTYDCATSSFYRGERGERTEVVNNDKEGTTRSETKWRAASGTVWRNFDDVLILASKSLPEKQTERLEPWDLAKLVPYQEHYLSGFRAEIYQVDLESGFTKARDIMAGKIRDDVRRDIGGDEQRIDKISTEHNAITFKHILLPVYLAAYRYGDEVYQFVINGRTGEVQGERPYSKVKIIATIAGVIAVIAGVIALWKL